MRALSNCNSLIEARYWTIRRKRVLIRLSYAGKKIKIKIRIDEVKIKKVNLIKMAINLVFILIRSSKSLIQEMFLCFSETNIRLTVLTNLWEVIEHCWAIHLKVSLMLCWHARNIPSWIAPPRIGLLVSTFAIWRYLANRCSWQTSFRHASFAMTLQRKIRQ